MPCLELEHEIQSLIGTGYDQYPISPKTPPLPKGYNCIAFAAGHTDSPPGDMNRPWWPHPNKFYFWPPHLPREYPGLETVENFVRAFEWIGYRRCKDGKLRTGIEKVVIFLKNNRPTHAARQLESGLWTSKCGRLEDIQHETLTVMECSDYGKAAVFLHRRRDGKPF